MIELRSGSTQSRPPKGIAREEGEQRDIRRTFKILKEAWLDIGIEKIDTHKGIIVKALLDSGAMEMFMDRKEKKYKY